jgi:Flavodoxin-like fold
MPSGRGERQYTSEIQPRFLFPNRMPRERKALMLLLNIQSSPRGAKSASIAVTNAFLDAYLARHSDATIDTLNVWEENLPDFDQEAIGAKYKGVNKQPMAPGSRDRCLEQNPGAGGTLPASGSHRARRAHVELRLPLQAQAID